MLRPIIAASCLICTPLAAQAGTLTIFASGEDLATEGFRAPKLTRDGWALEFSRIMVTFDLITAWQSDPPFMADGPQIDGAALPFGGPFTVDLVDADADDRVQIAALAAEQGHYNALSWALSPAATGEFAGYSLVLEGVAQKDGHMVDFTLRSTDSIAHACGEYQGDRRKGIVADGAAADLEITLHLDHLFGRADKDAQDQMNLGAPGFDAFAQGGVQNISLDGVHLGHVGEGHCHVSPL